MNVRLVLEAQHSDAGRVLEPSQADGQSVRIKMLGACTVGAVTTLATRVARVVVVSAASPLTYLYSIGRGARYGLEGEVWDNSCSIGREWMDLEAAVEGCAFAIPGAFCCTSVGTARMNSWKEYYVNRIDERAERNVYVAKKIAEYDTTQKAVKAAWQAGEKPPVPGKKNK
jgi:hypothetical protein